MGDYIGKPCPPMGIHVPTVRPSQPPGDHITAPSRGVQQRRRQGRRCEFISSTGMSGIQSILEEGNLSHPLCPCCKMLVTWLALNGRGLDTAQCVYGVEWKHRRLKEEERAFQAYGKPMETITSFKYLGQVLTTEEEYLPAVAGNLIKARKSWTRITRILG